MIFNIFIPHALMQQYLSSIEHEILSTSSQHTLLIIDTKISKTNWKPRTLQVFAKYERAGGRGRIFEDAC